MRYLVTILVFLSAPAFAGEIGIVISTDAGQLRRVIVPDNDAQLHKQNWAAPGETLLVRDASVDITAEIQKFTGKPVTIPLAAAVDKNGNVVSTVVADPTLDKSDDGTLVAAFPGVKIGQIFDSARGVFIEPAHDVQTTVDVGGTLIDETILIPTTDVAPRLLDLQPPLKLTPAQ